MRKAFTLIELLVVIAIIAILAAILFPVFAQAKAAAKVTSTLSGLKQISLALPMYSTDFDDVAVWEYGYSTPEQPALYLNGNTWVGRVMPYTKNRSIFFDKTISETRAETVTDPFFNDTYRWEWITNLAINTDGYVRSWPGESCTNYQWWATSSVRSLSGFEDTAARLAVTPVRYANLDYGWMRFYGAEASWPTMDRYATGWSWYQLIFDTRRQYSTAFIGAFADGHAGRFNRSKFVAYFADTPAQNEANSYAEYCQAMERNERWAFWGRPWSGN